jgi:transporter family protein
MIPRWLIWTLLALLCWGIWALLSKMIGDALSPSLNQALSTLGTLPVIIALVFSKKTRGGNKIGSAYAFASGLISGIGNIAYYAVLNSGAKAATVVPLTALYPLVTVLLAVAFLKEKLNRIQIAGIILALVAIYFFNIPTEENALNRWLALALIPLALWGVTGLLQKMATNHISGELSAFWFLAAFIPIAIVLFFLEPIPALTTKSWTLVLLLGLTLALGNVAILVAFASDGKASIIAPLAGLYPLVSIPIAIVALGERISPREGVGVVTALAAVMAISIESKK